MYAVIFRSEINTLTEAYYTMAKKLRDLAIQEYGCVEFTAVMEEKQEIAISYWNNLEDIEKWKQDPVHLMAQGLGQSQFYNWYKVQVVEVLREYQQ